MKKIFFTSILSIFLFTFVLVPAFAQVEGPREGCEVSTGAKAGNWHIEDLLVLSGTVNNEVAWLHHNNVSLFPNTINAKQQKLSDGIVYVVTNLSSITDTTDPSAVLESGNMIATPKIFIMPQTAFQDGFFIANIKKGDILPSNWAVFCLLDTVNTITDWIFTFIMVVAVAFIAIAGFMWATSGASPEQQKKAGGMMKAAIIGITIAILAKVIPALVVGILL